MIDKGLIAPFLASPLVNLFEPVNQIKPGNQKKVNSD